MRSHAQVAKMLQMTETAVWMAEFQAVRRIRAAAASGGGGSGRKMSACSLAAGRHPRSEMVREVGRWLTEVIPGLLERGKTDEAAEVRAAVERWQQNLRMKAILVEPDGRLVPEDADLSLVAMDRPNFYFTTGGRVSTVWSWDRLRRSAPGGVWFGRFWILAVEAAVPLPEPQVTPKDPQPRGRNGCFTAKAKGAEVAP